MVLFGGPETLAFVFSIFMIAILVLFFFSSRRRHTRSFGDWSSDVCSSDLYFGHLMRRVDSLEKTFMLGGIGGKRRRGRQRMIWLDGITLHITERRVKMGQFILPFMKCSTPRI